MNRHALSTRWQRGVCVLLAALLVSPSATPQEPLDRQALLQEFQDLRLLPDSGGFLIVPGEFPKLRWEQPHLVLELFGKLPLEAQWYDAAGNQVAQAQKPGRYGVYVEGRTADGMVVRRGLTFYCIDPETAMRVADENPLRLAGPPFGLSNEIWTAHRDEIERFLLDAVAQRVEHDPQAGILAAGLAEWDPQSPHLLAAPSIRHQEYHLRLKQKLLNVEAKYPPLARPVTRDTPATMLREGTLQMVGISGDLPRKLEKLCQEWLEKEGSPFTVVVARRGVVVFHQAYGKQEDQPATRDTTYPLFSLTKMLTGVMLAEFLDAQLLDLDQPLGEVLPDLPTTGPNVITLRQCLMHTTGLEGHDRWGGPDNVWLDNVVANGLEAVRPTYRYSGVGYDLAGTAMQLVSGKSIPRLFHEHLFQPLGFEGARIADLGSGGRLRAIDLARVGQLLLNRGSYGEYEFFSPATYEKILPQAYEEWFPGLAPQASDYGLGLYWARDVPPPADQEHPTADARILSPRTLSHGAFSGTVFRVDLENELVVVVGRIRSGVAHDHYVKSLLMTVKESLRE
jgi:CubicO group peptidase (beta-lactamase class C family)